MYCSIRNFNEFNFNGDLSHIKEFIYDFVNDAEHLLKVTKCEQDVVIKMPMDVTNEQIELVTMLCEARDNVRLMVCDDLISGLPCFFRPGYYNADSLDKFNALCEKGVTDIYVTGQLAFQMPLVKKLSDKYNIKTRVIPNMAQISGFGIGHMQKDGNVTAFWIRPEDLSIYSEFIDVVEFIGQDEKQAVFYEIYFLDKKWDGNLGVIVAGLGDVNNRGIPVDFTTRRLNCSKKCLVDACHSCYKYKNLADLIKEHKLDVTFESM